MLTDRLVVKYFFVKPTEIRNLTIERQLHFFLLCNLNCCYTVYNTVYQT